MFILKSDLKNSMLCGFCLKNCLDITYAKALLYRGKIKVFCLFVLTEYYPGGWETKM